MQVICIRNVSEISHFLTVIEFNTKFEEKRSISYTAISIKVVTETIIKCAIWADDGNNHSFK
jgi:hypothetical protein